MHCILKSLFSNMKYSVLYNNKTYLLEHIRLLCCCVTAILSPFALIMHDQNH